MKKILKQKKGITLIALVITNRSIRKLWWEDGIKCNEIKRKYRKKHRKQQCN